ncbi:P-II family nitrogen regulator [Methanobacterium oryzae]|uniref:P-II family nitrogen regulator n=1 Tax=Methanobacterium oryzae TaxID=69540 RepID=UPI003D1C535A
MKQVLFLGASGSGKTTALKHINNDKDITILTFDYGKATIGNNTAYIFNSKDTTGFKFIQDVLTDDIDGIIIFIDNKKGITETDIEIISYITKIHIPHIIFSNKQDLNPTALKIDFDGIIIPTIAIEGIGLNDGLKMLLNLIKRSKNTLENKLKEVKSQNDRNPNFNELIKALKPVSRNDREKCEICKLKLLIHPIELENVKDALADVGFSNITLIEVGYVDNHNTIRESYRGSNYNINIPPRMEINLIIKKEDVKYVIQAIKAIKTEDIVDDIFIVPVEDVVRIRTEERGEEAVE